jgi:hypothetical protein
MQVSAASNDVLGTSTGIEIGLHIANGDFTASESILAATARLKVVKPELNAVARCMLSLPINKINQGIILMPATIETTSHTARF